MKYALVDGDILEAQPRLVGRCRGCGAPMVAKCGAVRIHHWAHKSQLDCDPWWEGETEWHREWKNHFPPAWQEHIQHADDGEKHIADVKTHAGWVLEFQHSYLSPEERKSREAFYSQMIWVVDARGKRARTQIIGSYEEGLALGPLRRISIARSEFLRKWVGCAAPVFLDLGESDPLGLLLGNGADGPAYLVQFSRTQFVDGHCSTTPEMAAAFKKLILELREIITLDEARARMPARVVVQQRSRVRRFRF